MGYDKPEIDNQVALIRSMDLHVGVPSIVLDPDTVRKARYGKAGAFRPKEYGVEYRVASNFWIKTPQLMTWVYENTHKAIDFLNQGNEIKSSLAKDIQHAINSGKVDLAKDISREFGILQGI